MTPILFLTEGAQFFSLVKSLAKRYGDNKKLHFLWVDPDPFPTVSCTSNPFKLKCLAYMFCIIPVNLFTCMCECCRFDRTIEDRALDRDRCIKDTTRNVNFDVYKPVSFLLD